MLLCLSAKSTGGFSHLQPLSEFTREYTVMTTSNSEETMVVTAGVLGVSQEPLDKGLVLRLILLPYGVTLEGVYSCYIVDL